MLQDPPTLVLATVATARLQLPGHDEDDILSLVEEGHIPFAWNIALDHKANARELRLWPDCIRHYAETGGRELFPINSHDTICEQLLRSSADKPFIFATTIRLLLNCGPTHVTNLVDAKLLKQLRGTEYRRGPNGAACITRESFIKFLKSRLEGDAC